MKVNIQEIKTQKVKNMGLEQRKTIKEINLLAIFPMMKKKDGEKCIKITMKK